MSIMSIVLARRLAVAFACLAGAVQASYAQEPANAPARPRQGPEGPRAVGMAMAEPREDVASMLLAHTGELKLTDQQVTRLAAIARRSSERRQQMRAAMDSAMRGMLLRRNTSDRTAMATPENEERGRAMMQRARDQERSDVREALGVLSLDQQADAWMLRGARPGPMGMRPDGGRRPQE